MVLVIGGTSFLEGTTCEDPSWSPRQVFAFCSIQMCRKQMVVNFWQGDFLTYAIVNRVPLGNFISVIVFCIIPRERKYLCDHERSLVLALFYGNPTLCISFRRL